MLSRVLSHRDLLHLTACMRCDGRPCSFPKVCCVEAASPSCCGRTPDVCTEYYRIFTSTLIRMQSEVKVLSALPHYCHAGSNKWNCTSPNKIATGECIALHQSQIYAGWACVTGFKQVNTSRSFFSSPGEGCHVTPSIGAEQEERAAYTVVKAFGKAGFVNLVDAEVVG